MRERQRRTLLRSKTISSRPETKLKTVKLSVTPAMPVAFHQFVIKVSQVCSHWKPSRLREGTEHLDAKLRPQRTSDDDADAAVPSTRTYVLVRRVRPGRELKPRWITACAVLREAFLIGF